MFGLKSGICAGCGLQGQSSSAPPREWSKEEGAGGQCHLCSGLLPGGLTHLRGQQRIARSQILVSLA